MSKRKPPAKPRKPKVLAVHVAPIDVPYRRLVPRIIPEPEPAPAMFESALVLPVITPPYAPAMPVFPPEPEPARGHYASEPPPVERSDVYAAVGIVVVLVVGWALYSWMPASPRVPVTATAPIAPAVVDPTPRGEPPAPVAAEPEPVPEPPPAVEVEMSAPPDVEPAPVEAIPEPPPAQSDAERLNRRELRAMRRYERRHHGELQ